MELTAAERDLFSEYLGGFDSLTGDRRTRTVFHETVRGIIGAERLCCRRIATFSPVAAEGASGGRGELRPARFQVSEVAIPVQPKAAHRVCRACVARKLACCPGC